jgi:hypothetical protein
MWFNKSPFEWAFCNKSFNINLLCSHLWEKNFKHDSMMLPHRIIANTSHDITLFNALLQIFVCIWYNPKYNLSSTCKYDPNQWALIAPTTIFCTLVAIISCNCRPLLTNLGSLPCTTHKPLWNTRQPLFASSTKLYTILHNSKVARSWICLVPNLENQSKLLRGSGIQRDQQQYLDRWK